MDSRSLMYLWLNFLCSVVVLRSLSCLAVGKWAVEPLKENKVPGDQGLVLKSRAKHHAIAAMLDKPFVFRDKPLVVQWVASCTDTAVANRERAERTGPDRFVFPSQVRGEFPGRHRLWRSIHQTSVRRRKSQPGWFKRLFITTLFFSAVSRGRVEHSLALRYRLDKLLCKKLKEKTTYFRCKVCV